MTLSKVIEGMEDTNPLALPNLAIVERELQAVRAFQKLIQTALVRGHDFGVIPGTQKPTLLKPGAEKIIKLLRLADTYEILSKTEDWKQGFFAYEVRVILSGISSGQAVSTGLGECNSMESKYRWRWVFKSELDNQKLKSEGLPTKSIRTTKGPATLYRIPNEDVYSQVNTILKMAKKRALVDAALSAGRLSDVFTQDIEDKETEEPVETGIPSEPKVLPSPVASTTTPSQTEAPSTTPGPKTKAGVAVPVSAKSLEAIIAKAVKLGWSIPELEGKLGVGLKGISQDQAEEVWDFLDGKKPMPVF